MESRYSETGRPDSLSRSLQIFVKLLPNEEVPCLKNNEIIQIWLQSRYQRTHLVQEASHIY
jgi:hypothetical protein